jgi:hypothetical protein
VRPIRRNYVTETNSWLGSEIDEYAVDVRPGEVLQWLRDDAGRKQPSLLASASKEYRIETDFDHGAAGIGAEDDLALVTATGMMAVTPLRGRRGWVLQLRAEDSIGLKPIAVDERYEDDDELTVEAFVNQFLVPEEGEIEATIHADDEAAWRRFQDWLARRRAAERRGD